MSSDAKPDIEAGQPFPAGVCNKPHAIAEATMVRSLSGITILCVACLGLASHVYGKDLIDQRETSYNNVYVFADGKYRYLEFGNKNSNYIESVVNIDDDLDLPVQYTRYMTAALAYANEARRIVEIGFGGGRTTWYLHRSVPTASIIAVELDPDVVELAKKYFGIREDSNFHVVVQDGRRYLSDSKERADVIMLDAYRGDFVPFHLLTREFYLLVKNSLSQGGVVVQNVEPTTMLFDASVATIKSAFDNVEAFDAGDNIVVIAYDGPPKTAESLRQRALELQNRYHLRYRLDDLIRARRDWHDLQKMVSPEFAPLIDDFAPTDALKAIKRHNRKW
jgi:spermidine synthase